MTKDTGGPAFPAPAGVSHITEQGMTLRDYAAIKAMQGVLASGNLPKFTPDLDVAECSYRLADAMLKARQA
jgi:hypothetical protein